MLPRPKGNTISPPFPKRVKDAHSGLPIPLEQDDFSHFSQSKITESEEEPRRKNLENNRKINLPMNQKAREAGEPPSLAP